MNGRTAKKLRKIGTLSFFEANAEFCRQLIKLPFRQRFNFGIALLLKRKWRGA
jgi:hypothetical protein